MPSNPPDNDRLSLIQAARTSPVTFVNLAMAKLIPGYEHFEYVDLVAAHIEGIISPPQPDRLVINLPPRHGKSFLMIAAAAWYLGRYPEREVMLVAHSQSLVNDLAAKLRQLVETEFFAQVFPQFRLLSGRERSIDFRTSRNGGFVAGSFDTGLTGRGADLLLIDDPISAQDVQSEQRRAFVRETFDAMLMTRLNDLRTGAVIAMSHRLHADDLSAHLIGLGFRHLRLPFRAERDEEIPYGDIILRRAAGGFLQHGRITQETARKLETLPAHVFATQYQQNPMAAGSGLLKLEHFPIIESPPSGGTTVISWDTASSLDSAASYSVALVFRIHSSVAYLAHIQRARLEYADLKRCAVELHERFRPQTHLVEAASLGRALASDLRDLGANVIDRSTGRASKIERLEAVFHKLVAGYVQVPARLPNLAVFLDECTSFPHGQYDDQVDALTQFLAWQSDGSNPMNHQLAILRVRPRDKYAFVRRMTGQR